MQVVTGVVKLVSNLRSSVCRNALLALHDFFYFMKRQMDPTLDKQVRTESLPRWTCLRVIRFQLIFAVDVLYTGRARADEARGGD